MAAEQGLDPEQGRSQLTPSRSRPYSAIWTVFSCIIVQALVGFGFQTRYFSQAQVDELKDQPERFLHWVSLTNSYALMATVVALALPYVRRGYHKMIILAVGILAAFSGGVMQASPPTVEQVRFATLFEPMSLEHHQVIDLTNASVRRWSRSRRYRVCTHSGNAFYRAGG